MQKAVHRLPTMKKAEGLQVGMACSGKSVSLYLLGTNLYWGRAKGNELAWIAEKSAKNLQDEDRGIEEKCNSIGPEKEYSSNGQI